MAKKELSREQTIVRTSGIGIAANVLLAAFKAAVGLISNSIAIVLDAVNNLSDALSSVITIIGTRLAGRQPDKKHPLGHGRIEFLSALIVAAIVLYAGITSLVESVKKIISPETAEYTVVTFIVLVAAILVKLLLGRYVKRVGERVNSGALIASGADALFDALISLSVLISAVIYILWGVSLEAYVGVLISAFIIKAGIEMLLEPVNELLGKRMDRGFLRAIRETICEEEAVSGAYDLLLHSYGPDTYVGSVHVEIPDTMTAGEIDLMEHRITERVYEKHGVVLAGIGIYAVNTQDEEVKQIRANVMRIIDEHEGVVQTHGFRVDKEEKRLHLDIILDFALPDRQAQYEHICNDLCEAYPDYDVTVTMDIDV